MHYKIGARLEKIFKYFSDLALRRNWAFLRLCSEGHVNILVIAGIETPGVTGGGGRVQPRGCRMQQLGTETVLPLEKC